MKPDRQAAFYAAHAAWARDVAAGTSEHYDDAALYDFEYRRRRADVNHYRRLALDCARGGAVLELGSGSGRVLAPLVRDGHVVVGLDASRPMLRHAAQRLARMRPTVRARAHLLQGDMRRFALATRFRLVVCPFNAFQHLYTLADVAACLALVRAHLAPGGLFALDVLNPDLRWLVRDPRRRWARTRFRHPTTGERLEYTTNQEYDPVSQIAIMRIYYQPLEAGDDVPGRTRIVRIAHRQFFPAELEALLWHGGFAIVTRHGGFDGEPMSGGSESQVLVLAPR